MKTKTQYACWGLLGLAAMFGLAGCSFQSERVDLIVHNGVVLTLDGANTLAQAVAVDSGRVVAVGPERAILNKYAADLSVDLRGGVLTPGLMKRVIMIKKIPIGWEKWVKMLKKGEVKFHILPP